MVTTGRRSVFAGTFFGIWHVVQQAAANWSKHKAAQMGAALAFYSVLSLAPLVIVSLGVGFLLLTSLLLSTIIAAIGQQVGSRWPALEPLTHLGDEIVTFIVTALLFGMIFKLLPDTHVAWRDVWHGAVLTAVLFTVGKFAIGLYLGKSAVGSTFGAAGSLVVLLVWLYYSAQILFFGAELTHAIARREEAAERRA